jgi:hypothetical protein
MMISKAVHGESINWVIITFFQSIEALIRCEECYKNMIEGITKKEPKKDQCHSVITLLILFLVQGT